MKEETMKSMFLLYVLSFPLLIKAQEPVKLSWGDMKPVISYEDHFKQLSEEQLHNLRRVAIYRQWEANRNEPSSTDYLQQKDSLEHLLTREGVDIEYLFSIREAVTDHRMKEAENTRLDFNGQKVQIPGYLLPLDIVDEHATEFLPVPWVGAYIHTPPPQKTQMVYLKYDPDYKVTSRYEPVCVERIMDAQDIVADHFLLDGVSEIYSGYKISSSSITAYGK